MWALPEGDGFAHPGHRRYAEAYAQGTPAVTVEVVEDPDGTYYGWIGKDADQPSMIYANPMAFRMCFPYGPKAEEEAGHGRAVRLSITRGG
jgi:hypothetical protein